MLIIGEKLSIIAKRVREAMMKKDKGPIQEIATAQWKQGAGMIDANIGPAEDGGGELRAVPLLPVLRTGGCLGSGGPRRSRHPAESLF